jgi:uncharacterized 2Fe-2S/4Fe-4S cluster protein (DUF4445 family)
VPWKTSGISLPQGHLASIWTSSPRNSSLEGARQALLSADKLKEAEEITSKITYFELNANQSFMNKFVGCKFFLHTNLEYYPTVRAAISVGLKMSRRK